VVVDSIGVDSTNVFSPSSIFNYSAGGTVYNPSQTSGAADGMVAAPYDALKQAATARQRIAVAFSTKP